MFALALIVLSIALVLAVPVNLAVRAEWSDRVTATWRVRALFGLIDIASRPGPRRAAPPAKPRPPTTAPRRRRGSPLALLRTPGFVRRVVTLVNALARRLQVRAFELVAEYGFDDPADTGMAVGALAPVMIAAHARGLNVRLAPSFLEPCFEGHFAAALSVRPLSVFGVVLRFACSRPVWRAIRAWRLRA